MAAIIPVSMHHDLCRRLVAALGLPWPPEKLVIEIGPTAPVRVYVKGWVDFANMAKITEAFEFVPVSDVVVADDATVTGVP